ncbi:heterokaryon incompatibility protein-domain-containing protein [Phaeosphaeriaceae sp. PMI808]|nr:heterokaryon incompatibility protein-domain-containing protein [Phaeosphaeriaceae sp. PMI808]
MSALPNYDYKPLGTETTIRILVLHPTENFESPLEVSFSHYDRDAIGQTIVSSYYEAVSYCWGEPTFSNKILVQDCKFMLEITANVDSMLRHFRKLKKQRYLWIDALCINQSDPVEKTMQVRNMGKIYRTGAKTHVWLGHIPNFDSQMAFTYLKKLAVWHELKLENVESDRVDLLESDSHGLDANLYRLLLHPWFTRRWILQEITLGKDITIHCTTGKIAREWFANGLLARKVLIDTQTLPAELQITAALEAAINIITLPSQQRSSLHEALLTYVIADCHDPRDRIFALYGITQNNEAWAKGRFIPPPVDYSKTWIEIYTQVAHALVEFRPAALWRHLRAFHSISLSNSEGPSWVPDWRNIQEVPTSVRDVFPKHGMEEVVPLDGKLGLKLRGWLYGPVSNVWSGNSLDHSTLGSIIHTVAAAEAAAKAGVSNSTSPQHLYDLTKYQILNLITLAARFIINPGSTSIHGLNEFWWTMPENRYTKARVSRMMWDKYDDTQPLFGQTNPEDIASLVNTVLQRHSLFRVNPGIHSHRCPRGLLGIMDGAIQPGDIPFRCHGPYIQESSQKVYSREDEPLLLLRPTAAHSSNGADRKAAFTFVGFCFIAGDKNECFEAERFSEQCNPVVWKEIARYITLV